MNTALDPGFLTPWGKALLMASFGIMMIKSMREGIELTLGFERLVIGFMGIVFFQEGALLLSKLSSQLVTALSTLGGEQNLKELLADAFRKAADEPHSGGGYNIPALIEQAWRTGVWGVLSSIVDWIFLLMNLILECTKEVLWSLLVFVFPLSCGAYPVLPSLMTNLIVYAVELSLWTPMLCVVQLVTSQVAQKYMVKAGSWGLYLIAVEIVAIVLMLCIPAVTHRFMSGALSGDFESSSGVLKIAKSALLKIKVPGVST